MFIGLFIFYAVSINNNINSAFSKITKSFDNLTYVINLQVSVNNLSKITQVYLNTKDKTWEKRYEDTVVLFTENLDKINLSQDWAEGVTILEQFKKTTTKLQAKEALAIKKANGGDISGARAVFDSEYADNSSLAGNLIFMFIDKESGNVSSEIVDNQNFLIAQEIFFIFLAILFLLIALLIIVNVFNKQVLAPVEKLAGITKLIANGDMTLRAEVANRDEIGSLAYNFNIMLDRLQFSQSILNITISDLTIANDKLKKRDQIKSDFVTVAAHQLRTPLTGIKWSLTAIMNSDMGAVSDMQKEYLKGAIESNQRMIDTADDILKMDNIQSGKLDEDDELINPTNILNSVLFDIYPQATSKNLKINLNIEKNSLATVKIGQGEIRVILQNILENAVLYSKEKGVIDVSMDQQGDNVVFSARDYGIGIPRGEKKNIYTKFFRATNAIRHYANGSGLGLIVSKNLVERHGGKIWFESEEDQGTTFFVSFPIES